MEHRLHPFSAGLIVPLFALAAAGIPLAAAADALGEPKAIGAAAGLLLGKPVGILLGARLATRAGVGELPAGVAWRDVTAVAVLGGIGYTVSLLIAHLASPDPGLQEQLGAAVLVASALAALAAVVLLRRRSGAHRPPEAA
jgi:Na+:H+ antiporter, NhaA family